MSDAPRHRLPPDQQKALHKARRLEAVWLVVLSSIIVVIYFTLGNSQAMKTAWIEDMTSFIPPVAFLAASWIESRAPNDRFPLGYVRVTSIGYLVSAVALAGVGLFLITDAAHTLIAREHATIGSVEFVGVTFWFGWLMIAGLIYSAILPVIFGRLKLAPARELHDKILLSDALMNKADWMTGLAAAIGVIGIGFGLWWADAVAAIIISLDVLHDGFKNTSAAIRDLSDEIPRTMDDSEEDGLVADLQACVDALPWVEESHPELREEGRFLSGTIFVRPSGGHVDSRWIEEAEAALQDVDWRVHNVVVAPRTDLNELPVRKSIRKRSALRSPKASGAA